MVELHLDRLPAGRSSLELDHELERGDQTLQGRVVRGFVVKVTGTLEIEAMDQKILVHGDFTARRAMLCDRCGDPFDLDYPVSIEVLVYRQPGRGGDEEMRSDDNWLIHQPGGLVDLTEALLEAVVLDEPLHVAHPEHLDGEAAAWSGKSDGGDTGDDGAVDPRWEALRRLRRGADGRDDSDPS